MTGFLVDTSVVSETAPTRAPTPEALAKWLRTHDGALYLSAVTLAEIAQGAAKLHRVGATARATAIEGWLATLGQAFGRRVLPFDTDVARVFGTLADAAIASGRHPGFADVAIAATAAAHDLTIATRNIRHFAPLGVPVIDPSMA